MISNYMVMKALKMGDRPSILHCKAIIDGVSQGKGERWQCGGDIDAVIITAHPRQLQKQLSHWISTAACRREQRFWARTTYVSMRSFLMAPFGLMPGRFHLHQWCTR